MFVTLQAGGCEVSAELEFLDQQNIILNLENTALKQRLDSLAQEQFIKHRESSWSLPPHLFCSTTPLPKQTLNL